MLRRQVGDHFSVGIEWFIVHRFVGPCGPCGSINALCALGLSCFRQIYGLSLGWVKAIAIASRIHYEGTTLFSRISYGSVSHEICSALPCSNTSGLPWNFLEHSLSLNFLKKNWAPYESYKRLQEKRGKKTAACRAWACLNARPLCLDGLPWQCSKEVERLRNNGRKRPR